MNTILQKIVETKQYEVSQARKIFSLHDIEQEALAQQKTMQSRDFIGSIQASIAQKNYAVIAEIKKASPSKGVIRENFAIADIAPSYEEHGATTLSVLTDMRYFQGAPLYIRQSRMFSTLPILRKDFILDPYQVFESKMMGSDAILLIADILSASQMQELESIAIALGMAVLPEVHDITQLPAVYALKTPLLGINNRNLHDFNVNLDTSIRVAQHLDTDKAHKILVTESGINQPSHIQQMQEAGIHTFLIGEHFMKSPNPGEALATLFAQN